MNPLRLFLLVVLGAPLSVTAAGGHFAVDDAVMLDVGQCQVETWLERDFGASRSLLHLGPGCRLGPFEASLNLDDDRPGDDRRTTFGPQLKWVRQIDDRWGAGLVVAPNWMRRPSGFAGVTLYAPVSVRVVESLHAHLNLGRDFVAGSDDFSRAGIAFEWQATGRWMLVGERFRQAGGNYGRLGARWSASDAVSLDLSRADGLGATPGGWWTVGVNWLFERGRAAPR